MERSGEENYISLVVKSPENVMMNVSATNSSVVIEADESKYSQYKIVCRARGGSGQE